MLPKERVLKTNYIMTTEAVSFLAGIGAILTFLVPSIQLIVNKNHRGLKRVTIIGWITFVISFYLLFVCIAAYHTSKRDKLEIKKASDSIKHAEDSIHSIERRVDRDSIVNAFQNALRPLGQQYNPSTGKISHLAPILTIPSLIGKPNPTVTKNGDSLLFIISFTNANDQIAKNIKTYFSVLTPLHGSFFVSSADNNLANETVIIDNKSYYTISKPLRTESNYDSAFIYLKITFTDINNRPQEPFRTIALFTRNLLGKDLEIPNEEVLNNLKRTLVNKGEW